MKKIVMGSLLALSSVFTITACTSVGASTDTSASTPMQKHHQGKTHKQGMKGTLAQLNLSAAQQSQLKAIRQSNSGDRMQKREAMMKVLTNEQRAQLETLKSERKNKHQH